LGNYKAKVNFYECLKETLLVYETKFSVLLRVLCGEKKKLEPQRTQGITEEGVSVRGAGSRGP
jgi:hypothetical protein